MTPTQLTPRFYHRLRIKTIIAAVVGIVLFVNHQLHPFIPNLTSRYGHWIWYAIGVFSTYICFHCGSYIYRTAWRAFKANETNKNTLIAIGTLVLLIYSFLRIIFPHKLAPLFLENYFVSAVLIIALVNFSTLLEAKAKRTNQFLITHLQTLLPDTVVRIDENGDEQTIAVKDVQVGDILKAEVGQMFVADGIITQGETKVDNFALTRETMPRKKEIDDVVIAGAINKKETVLYKAQYVGKHTALAHITDTVIDAQVSPTKRSKRMDVFVAVFVPVILLLAIVTMLVWYNFGPAPHYVHAMLRAVSVLVIVSPTALALSIPMPILMGIGKAAEYGILVRNAKTLMLTAKITTFIFDKSGIITKGKPKLISIHPVASWDENQVLQYAASLENKYEHPIANAIVDSAKERSIELLSVTDFNSKPAYGVKGLIDGKEFILGNRKYMRELNIQLNGVTESAQRMAQQGHTILLLACNNEVIGFLALKDKMRREARDAFMRIKELGLQTVMFTAGNRESAENLGRKLGINKVFADIQIEGKVNEIERLQRHNEIVAYVAEGATDAQALEKANVSIAVATNDHLLMETAGINLMRNSLHGVADAIRIARATKRKIKQNLIFSSVYNILALLFAAGIFYHLWHFLIRPTEATVVMTICTLLVIFNSNRLLHFKPFKSKK